VAILIGHVNGSAILNPIDFSVILYRASSTLARHVYCAESLQHPGRGKGCHIQDSGKGDAVCSKMHNQCDKQP
jgi:hypothetical protein